MRSEDQNINYEKYMRIAIALAKKAEGRTSPNPIVGAVIVKNGRIVGRGYHRRAGLPHAEIEALSEAGPNARGAVMFVTLEPCDHFGRTPPCTDAVIKSGIKKVVMGMKDPNPLNNGAGAKRLKARGIKTVTGVLEEDVRRMNRPFIKYVTKKMPYVIVKLAETLDGKIATRAGDSRWISSPRSRLLVRNMRSMADAVMVGANTVINDDPSLLTKIPGARQPARIIVDSRLRSPVRSKVFGGSGVSPVLVAVTARASAKKAGILKERGVEIVKTASLGGRVDLKDLLRKLAARGIINILVEGGGELAWSLADKKLADKFVFFIAPMIVGGRKAVPSVGGSGVVRLSDAITFRSVRVRMSGPDIMVEAEV